MKRFFVFIWEVLKIVIIALAIVIPIRYFLFQPFIVRGQSMEPAFEHSDYLIVDEISYRLRDPQRGEVIIFVHPQNPSQKLIKRIIGLPGETVKFRDGKIIISQGNDEFFLDELSYLPPSVQTEPKLFDSVTLRENEYFVLGDNRANSSDSRVFGPLPRERIIGRVIFRAWPLTAFTKFEVPAY